MKKTFFTILLLSGILKLTAQENHLSGARPLSLSNSFVSISDIWSTFHNQAALAKFDKPAVAFFYGSRFGIKELSQSAVSLVLPIGSGTFGASFSQFGKARYKENKVGFCFAKALSEKLCASVQLDYLALLLPENDRQRGFITFEAGAVYSFSKYFNLGAHVYNPASSGIKTVEGKIASPTIFRFGGHIYFDENVLCTAEIQKDTKHPALLKSGIEFSPATDFFIRIGVSGKPFQYTSGIGFRTGMVKTDIAFGYHGNLGLTPSVSIQIDIPK